MRKKDKSLKKLFRKNKSLFRYFLYLFAIILLVLGVVFLKYSYSEKYGRIKVSRLSYDITDEYKQMIFEIKEDDKPVFKEIVYENMTREEVIEQINKSLTSTLTGTGDIFVDESLKRGIDPYVAVAISLYETGCKWGCSRLVRECYNLGGLKGSPSCDGTSFKRYDSMEEGIIGYLTTIEYYYKNGMDTPEKMEYRYSGGSTTWAGKVNAYINSIKSK